MRGQSALQLDQEVLHGDPKQQADGSGRLEGWTPGRGDSVSKG